jgi:hypothetical protein
LFCKIFLGALFFVLSFVESKVFAAGGACNNLMSVASDGSSCTAWCGGQGCLGGRLSSVRQFNSCMAQTADYCACYSATGLPPWQSDKCPSTGSGVSSGTGYLWLYIDGDSIYQNSSLCGYKYDQWSADSSGAESRRKYFYTGCNTTQDVTPEYRCAQDYYGTGSACTRCPGLPGAAASGGYTSNPGSVNIRDCWVYGGDEHSYTDDTGIFAFTDSCVYTGS